MDAVGSEIIVGMKKRQLEQRIQELKLLISQYRSKVNCYDRQMKSADKSYDSITRFKGSVQQSQESFSGANNIKSKALEQVSAVSTNNIVAKKYYAGMKRVLTGTGSRIVSKLYNYLLSKIKSEQTALKNKSNECMEKIYYYNKLINNAQAEINLITQELQSL